MITLKNKPGVSFVSSVCGKKEFDGPLGDKFDMHSEDDTFGKKSFEAAEQEMQRTAFALALHKSGLRERDIGAIFAGDLMNQCTASSYGLSQYDVPYFGLFGACSTMAEAMILAAICVDGGYYRRCAALACSHNCTAQRQFRYPVEYGGQRTPTAQWTVTGAGCALIDGGGVMKITEALPGRAVDKKIKDANNMGAAMAPAAADTLLRYFRESGSDPHDFDMIVTGDLGREGHSITKELCAYSGVDLGERYLDFGMLIYDETQDVHSGGSGCGCSAIGLAAFLYEKFRSGECNEALFIGTGALMSPLSLFQGESIPGIAHLLRFSSGRQ
ncbi:MAG: stage V sporulation protein AD [Clostridia bacterium]|nr:stage V sporulation protein AD [Clostridia bacterium]